MSESTKPHDALFKVAFSHLDSARSLLRLLVPPELEARVDWSSLRLESSSFVDPILNELSSDLLFSAPLAGRRTFVYLLFEHQSRPDRLMPYRIYRYAGEIWGEFFKQHEPGAPVTRIPAIVPIVLHHGAGGWNEATDLHELIDLPAHLLDVVGDYVPRARFRLYDISGIDENELLQQSFTALARAALLLFRNARRRTPQELYADLERWIETFLEIYRSPNGVGALRALMRYILLANRMPVEQLAEFAGRLGPAGAEIAMTTGQQLIAEGEARGKAAGKAEGKAEAILLVLRRNGVAVSDEDRTRILACTHLQTLEHWLDRAFDVENIEELFG